VYRLHAKLSIGFHGKNNNEVEEPVKQSSLKSTAADVYQVKFIFNHIHKCENVQTVNRNFFVTFYIESKSKASLCVLCTNTSEMNCNGAVYQN